MTGPYVESNPHTRSRINRHLPLWMRDRREFIRSVFWQSHPDSVARAVAIALFLVFLPLPIKSFVGVLACISLRANIPIMLALVWINNPLTFVPICVLSYKFGQTLLGMPASDFSISSTSGDFVQSSFSNLTMQSFVDLLLPLFTGAISAGIVLGVSGYVLTHLLWRLAKPAT